MVEVVDALAPTEERTRRRTDWPRKKVAIWPLRSRENVIDARLRASLYSAAWVELISRAWARHTYVAQRDSE